MRTSAPRRTSASATSSNRDPRARSVVRAPAEWLHRSSRGTSEGCPPRFKPARKTPLFEGTRRGTRRAGERWPWTNTPRAPKRRWPPPPSEDEAAAPQIDHAKPPRAGARRARGVRARRRPGRGPARQCRRCAPSPVARAALGEGCREFVQRKGPRVRPARRWSWACARIRESARWRNFAPRCALVAARGVERSPNSPSRRRRQVVRIVPRGHRARHRAPDEHLPALHVARREHADARARGLAHAHRVLASPRRAAPERLVDERSPRDAHRARSGSEDATFAGRDETSPVGVFRDDILVERKKNFPMFRYKKIGETPDDLHEASRVLRRPPPAGSNPAPSSILIRPSLIPRVAPSAAPVIAAHPRRKSMNPAETKPSGPLSLDLTSLSSRSRSAASPGSSCTRRRRYPSGRRRAAATPRTCGGGAPSRRRPRRHRAARAMGPRTLPA